MGGFTSFDAKLDKKVVKLNDHERVSGEITNSLEDT